jgi:hypothetical protein
MSTNPWAVIAVFLTIPCYAQSAAPAKPVCNAHTRGKLWPEKTSRGADVPIEICAPKRWKYAWRQLTVDVSQLRTIAARKPVIAGLTAKTDSVDPPVE